jgi:hypothetical protein
MGDLARVVRHPQPPVPQRLDSRQHAAVVPRDVPLHGVAAVVGQPVQFHAHAVVEVTDVVVLHRRSLPGLDLPSALRQLVRPLDVPQVPLFQGRLDAEADIGQRRGQLAPPAQQPVPRFKHAHGDQVGRGLAPLACLDRPVHGVLGGRRRAREVKYREMCPGQRRDPVPARHPELRLRQPRRVVQPDPLGRRQRPRRSRDADVDRVGRLVREPPHLGGRLVAEHPAVPDPQHRAPQPGQPGHRPARCVVDPAVQALPSLPPRQRRDLVPRLAPLGRLLMRHAAALLCQQFL